MPAVNWSIREYAVVKSKRNTICILSCDSLTVAEISSVMYMVVHACNCILLFKAVDKLLSFFIYIYNVSKGHLVVD